MFWRIDRQRIVRVVDGFLFRRIKIKGIVLFLYTVLTILLIYMLSFITEKELLNFITAFLVIDISNSEKKNLELKDKIKFYESITLASKSLLCGFVAPLFYILIFSSNLIGIIYIILYNISETRRYNIIDFVLNALNIVPSLIIQGLFYVVYVIRNKSFSIDFKGDYILNTLTRPLLNIEIMAAYIESVNFYYHFNSKELSFIKSYGKYNNKIDEVCLKDYLSINYATAFIYFMIFILINFFIK
ncbi:hypothetical protein [Desnuesiella massiliensis]|uniref:hypothetical protein n=1 Tax=Desnuesiella massiliensis TaxID=1650662 RepID=UPI0006E15191|nr:hypothetical protein [Desnuesiella massiliensis]